MSRRPSTAPQAHALPDAAAREVARRPDRWMALARWTWVLAAVLILGLDVLGTPAELHLAQEICAGSTCNLHQLTAAQAHQLQAAGLSVGFFAAYVVVLDWLSALVFVVIASVVWWRRSDDKMALFAAFMLLTFGAAAANGPLAALPAGNPVWTLPVNLANIIGQVSFYIFFCLFPSGRFAPRWLRWPALFWAAMWLGTLLPYAPLDALVTGPFPLLVFGIVLVVAQVYRYRRVSTPPEREQTKWVVFGFVVGLGGFIALLIVGTVVLRPTSHDSVQGNLFANTALTVLLWLIPVFIAVAILRSRLWDIDVLINRALVYGTLTAALAAVYLGVVIAAQEIGQALTGDKNPPAVVIVATTLLIAALFTPMRRRIQRAIDRRFYRSRYDAARTLSAFGSTLRTETDLGELSKRLVTVVDETMQPAHVSLWLRSPERRRGEPWGANRS